jgi:hypothetical protein
VSCDTKTEIDKVKLKHYVKNLTNFALKVRQNFTVIIFYFSKESYFEHFRTMFIFYNIIILIIYEIKGMILFFHATSSKMKTNENLLATIWAYTLISDIISKSFI